MWNKSKKIIRVFVGLLALVSAAIIPSIRAENENNGYSYLESLQKEQAGTNFIYNGAIKNGGVSAVGSFEALSESNGQNFYLFEETIGEGRVTPSFLAGTKFDTFYQGLYLNETTRIYVGATESDLNGTNNKGHGDAVVYIDNNNAATNKLITFGGSGYELFTSVTKTKDGGFVVAGYSESEDAGFTQMGIADGIIIKYDSAGNQQWIKNIGGDDFDVIYGIEELSDGSLVVVGRTETKTNFSGKTIDNKGIADAFVAKLTSTGNVEWVKTYGGSDLEIFKSVAVDKNDNIYAVGYSNSDDASFTNKGEWDAIVIKYNSSGVLQGETSFGGSKLDWFTGVAAIPNGDIAVAGRSLSDDTGHANVSGDNGVVVLLDKNLNIKKVFTDQITTEGAKDFVYEDIAYSSKDKRLYAVGTMTKNNDEIVGIITKFDYQVDTKTLQEKLADVPSKRDNYTASSLGNYDTIFEEATQFVRTVQENSFEYQQSEVDEKANKLTEAITALEVDTPELLNMIDDTITGTTYTVSSFNLYKTAVNNAKAFLEVQPGNTATLKDKYIEEALAKVAAVNEAISGLENKADVSALEELVAVTIPEGIATIGKQAVLDFQAAGRTILDGKNDIPDTEEGRARVTEACNNIRTALNNLKVERSGLQNIINTIDGSDTAKYTASSIAALKAEANPYRKYLDLEETPDPAIYNETFTLAGEIQGAITTLTPKPAAILVLQGDKKDLKALYNSKQNINTTVYTDATRTNFKKKLDHAKAIIESNDADQNDVNAALSGLKDALNILKLDTNELRNLIETANNPATRENKTPNSLTAMDTIKDSANTLAGELDALTGYDTIAPKISEYQTMVNNLNNAIGNLKEKGNKTDLKARVEELATTNLQGFTETTSSAYSTALSKANQVILDENAEQSHVNDALNKLNLAYNGLAIDFAPLQAAIQTAEAVPTEGKTPNSIKALNDEIKKAKEFLTENPSDYSGKRTVIVNISNEITELNNKSNLIDIADKSGLQILVERNYSEEYTAESKTDLENAKTAARAMILNDNATVEEVEAEIVALQAKFDNLVLDKTTFNNKINNYRLVHQETYTKSSYDLFKEALDLASAKLLENPTNFGEKEQFLVTIKTLLTAVENRKNQLVLLGDKGKLRVLMEEEIDTTGFTASSISAYTVLKNALQQYIDDPDLTVETADAKAYEVTQAKNDLQLDFSGLNSEINRGQADTIRENKTADSLSNLDREIEKGNQTKMSALTKTTYEEKKLEVSKIADAKAKITIAINNLVELADPTLIDDFINTNPINTQGFTQQTVNAYNEALQALNNLKTDPNRTIEKVNNAKELVLTKTDELTIDFNQLNQKITDAENLNKNSKDTATPQSLQELTTAINEAKTLKGTEAPDYNAKRGVIAQIPAAIHKITEKMNLIPKANNKGDLKALLDEGIPTGFVENSTKALKTALESAQEVFNNANATNEMVEEAMNKIYTARESLEVDKSEITSILNKYTEAEIDKYTPNSTVELLGALDTAADYYSETPMTFDEKKQLIANLKNSLSDIQTAETKLVPKGNKNLLRELYEKIINTEGFTEPTVNEYFGAKDRANNVLLDENATQEVVDGEIVKLQRAIDNLELDFSELDEQIRIGKLPETINNKTPASIENLNQKISAAESYKGTVQELTTYENKKGEVQNIKKHVEAIKEALQNLQEIANKGALIQKINDASLIDTKGFTTSSKEILENAIANANTIKNDNNVTQDQVDNAIRAIDKAYNNLKVDFSDLNEKINLAKNVDKTNKTPASISELQTAINEAENLKTENPTSFTEKQNLIQRIVNAIKKLDEKMNLISQADKSGLRTLVETKIPLGFTEETRNAVISAQEAGQLILDNPNVSDDQVVETAILNIQNAIDNLVVDKTALNNKIIEYSTYLENDYTPVTYQPFKEKLQEANNLAQEEAESFELKKQQISNINQVLSDLDTLKGQLQNRANKSELISLYKETISTTGFTESSIEAYDAKKLEAKTVIDNLNATQTEVNEMVTALIQAKNDLVIDMTALNNAINQAETPATTNNKTKSSKRNLQNKVEAGTALKAEALTKTTYNDKVIEVGKIEQAKNDILKAINDLVELGDNTELVAYLETDTIKAGFTDQSVSEYNELKAEAEELANDEDRTAEALANKLQNLKIKKDNLVVNLQPLQNAITTGQNTNTEGKTQNSVAKLEKAINEAITFASSDQGTTYNSKSLFIDGLNEKISKIQQAINDLETQADKTGLKAAIDEVIPEGFTASSVSHLEEVKDAAREVLNDQNIADESIILAEINKIKAAKNLLKADNTKLKNRINELDAINKTPYTTSSVNQFKALVDSKRPLLTRTTSNYAEALKLVSDLGDAFDALEGKESLLVLKGNTTELGKALGKACEIANKLKTLFTSETREELENAITEAETVIASNDVDQDDVDQALERINNAINNLKFDTSDLEALINQANLPETTNNKTKDSIDNLNSKKETAVTVNDEMKALTGIDAINPKIPAYNQAKADLKDALENMQVKGDSDLISEKLEEEANNPVPEEGFDKESKQAYDDALKDATSKLEDPNLTPEKVEELIAAIDEAKNNLVVDKSKLAEAITDAENTNLDDKTKETVDNLKDKINDGKVVRDRENPATYEEKLAEIENVKNAIDDINDAVEDLETKGDIQLIDDALTTIKPENVRPDGWTTVSKNNFDLAYNKLVALKTDENVTNAKIEAAINELKDAKETLVVNKQVGRDKVTEARGIDVTGKTNSSVKVLRDATDELDEILFQTAKTYAEKSNLIDFIKNGITKVNKAINDLKDSGNTAPLENLINDAETNPLPDKGFDPVTKKKYEDAIEDAKELIERGDLSTDEVNEAINKINEAKNNLKLDKTKLIEAIQRGEAAKTSDKTADTIAVLKTALNKAKTLRDEAEPATLEAKLLKITEINDAINDIDQAIANLKVKGDTARIDQILEDLENENIPDEGWTPSSKSDFDEAKERLEDLKDDPNLKDEDITSALNDLIIAKDNLEVDKTGAINLYNDIKGLDTSDKTKDSRDNLNQKNSELKNLIDQTPTTTEEKIQLVKDLDKKMKEVNTAKNNLVDLGDNTLIDNKLNSEAGTDVDYFTTESVDKYKKALKDLEDEKKNPNRTNDSINNLIQKVDQEKQALIIDKEALKKDINYYVSDAVIGGKTPKSIAPLRAKVEEALEKLKENPTTYTSKRDLIEDIKSKLSEMAQLKDELVTIPNKDNLKKLVEEKIPDGFTDDSKNALDEAKSNGQVIIDNEDASAEEVADAIKKIEKAKKNLEVDNSKLEKAKKDAEAVDTSNATPKSKKDLEDKIKEANDIIEENPTSYDEKVDHINRSNEVIKDLKDAEENLVTKGDKTGLEEIINNPVDTEDMTEESKNDLEDAIEKGREVLEDENASQKDVDDAIKKIEDAKDNLEVDTTEEEKLLEEVKEKLKNKEDGEEKKKAQEEINKAEKELERIKREKDVNGKYTLRSNLKKLLDSLEKAPDSPKTGLGVPLGIILVVISGLFIASKKMNVLHAFKD